MDARRTLNSGLDTHMAVGSTGVRTADAGDGESGGTSEYLWRVRSFAALQENVYYRVATETGTIRKYEIWCIAQVTKIIQDPKRGRLVRFRVSNPGNTRLSIGRQFSIDEKQDVKDMYAYWERGEKKESDE